LRKTFFKRNGWASFRGKSTSKRENRGQDKEKTKRLNKTANVKEARKVLRAAAEDLKRTKELKKYCENWGEVIKTNSRVGGDYEIKGITNGKKLGRKRGRYQSDGGTI